MPAKGGAAGKAGDHYEALWTVTAALRLIAGAATHVVYESLDPLISKGIEFTVTTASEEVEFWSVKRQTVTASGWTLATLVRPDENLRSILLDLVGHVMRDDRNVAVFASALAAPALEELRTVADDAAVWGGRLAQSSRFKADCDKYVLPLFGGNACKARTFLQRLRIQTVDATTLRAHVESNIEHLFYPTAGGPVDGPTVRRLLAEYLLDHVHRRIDRQMVLDHLALHGYRRKDWALDASVQDRVRGLCDAYTTPLRESLIGGTLQMLPGTDGLLDGQGRLTTRRSLLIGGAGSGKSSVLSHVVDRVRAAGIPVLPVRLDHVDEGVLTPQRLGEALSLPASPVAVVAGLAAGGNCVLVVDQLDAVSLASGRRSEVWSIFERLLIEAGAYPNMRVLVACRDFDVQHDQRMRVLTATTSGFVVVPIGAFTTKQVDDILGHRKVHSALKPLLTVPLHLAMFLPLGMPDTESIETRDELFAAFWVEKERRTSRRLGRACNFVEVIKALVDWFSQRQELSAPACVLDTVRPDADALTSERVLVLVDGRYRFFHETFFDYAFARGFARTGGRLLELLLSGEQHLFRRAQVRQVLSYLRSNDPTRYIEELGSVLRDSRVRFHVKRVVLQYLGSVASPMPQEWVVLRELNASKPTLRRHIDRVIAGHPGWFDVLEGVGYFDVELSSTDGSREAHAIDLLTRLLKDRSSHVAALLSKHRRADETWKRYLQWVCQFGQVFYHRDMFDLFLSLIDDGTLDWVRPAGRGERWWLRLHSMAKEAPAFACETIGAWFDRKLATVSRPSDGESVGAPAPATVGVAERSDGGPAEGDDEIDLLEPSSAERLRRHFAADGADHGVISQAAAAAPLAFAQHVLPRVAAFVADAARDSRPDRLAIDPLWSFRSFGEDVRESGACSSIYNALARALEALASSAPVDLDRLLDSYIDRPHDSIAYLVLRAWAAAPPVYADRLASYLAADTRRLKIGYASCVNASPGVAEGYRSIEAVRVSASACSPGAFTALEVAILNLADDWESRHPRFRGLRQLQLLTVIDGRRLGAGSRRSLAELRAKFPSVASDAPEPLRIQRVDSPIEPQAQEKMNDDHWLSALSRYAGVGVSPNDDIQAGESELAQSLEERAKADPMRFMALAAKMPNELPAPYFEAIVRGVADAVSPRGVSPHAVEFPVREVTQLLQRVHDLPTRPCGRWVSYLVDRWKGADWPPAITEVVSWYAINDPDPETETWRECGAGGRPYYGGNPSDAGLNSTRGAAAGAIARLLWDSAIRKDALLPAIDSLAHDRSIAVRARAVEALLALLNLGDGRALRWFVECVSADPILLSTPWVEHFVYYAGHRDYAAVRPVLQQMLAGGDAEAGAASRVCCLLALTVDAASEDAQQVRVGRTTWRKAAAATYGQYAADKEVGGSCRRSLREFHSDPDDDVRAMAAGAFDHIGDLATVDQSELLEAFLDSSPPAEALARAIRSIEDSPVRLPDLVCRLVEAGVDAFEEEAGDIRTAAALSGHELSKIVLRLYTQSGDVDIRRRCLDAIDRMELATFDGLDKELLQHDR